MLLDLGPRLCCEGDNTTLVHSRERCLWLLVFFSFEGAFGSWWTLCTTTRATMGWQSGLLGLRHQRRKPVSQRVLTPTPQQKPKSSEYCGVCKAPHIPSALIGQPSKCSTCSFLYLFFFLFLFLFSFLFSLFFFFSFFYLFFFHFMFIFRFSIFSFVFFCFI